jgi:beta-galactosidase/beta-glucuronidase
VRFTLRQGSRVVGVVTSAALALPAGAIVKATAIVAPQQPVTLWAINNPALYTLQVEVLDDTNTNTNNSVLDSLNVSTGFRSLKYTADHGMFLNGQNVKVRGFCDHNDFASVGMAVPDRIKLFRAQASRSVGGNGRRTSHNPPDPVMLDIYDRVGVVVMDENRQLGNSSVHENEMRSLVSRDRNHPSVVIWSFCNEYGCEDAAQQGGPRFQAATYELDGTRPTLGNMFTFNDLLSKTIDVQGFSHQSRDQVDQCHAAMPDKPIFMSECCSCNTMRGEDESVNGLQKSFNGDCQASQTNRSNGVPYVVGTMVWTLFDYYGEPSNGGWPFVSSTFGSFDLAGFAKSAVYWFRSQWLYSVPDSSVDKPFKTNGLGMQVQYMTH